MNARRTLTSAVAGDVAAIGAFYILTLYMGLGAMTSGVINPADSNMSAPLLARSFGELLFAVISAIAFATILGTFMISGLAGLLYQVVWTRYLSLSLGPKSYSVGAVVVAFLGSLALGTAWLGV